MNRKLGNTLSITVKFSAENAPVVLATAQASGLPLATWGRGVLEREAGVDGPVVEEDLTPVLRPEPMTEDERTRRNGVRRLGEIAEVLKTRDGVPEEVIAGLREATAAIVATLPRRSA